MSSILDRVLLSQEMTERLQLSPVDICTQLLKLLSNREAEVLRLRFGLDGDSPKTLETIGNMYAITRERVRQIEHQSIECIRHAKPFSAISDGISNLVQHALLSHGHIRRQDVLITDLLLLSGDSPMNRSSLNFIIEELLSHIVERVDDEDHHPSWKLKGSSLDLFRAIISHIKDIFAEYRQPLSFEDLFRRLSGQSLLQQHAEAFRAFSSFGAPSSDSEQEIVEQVIRSYLECSRHIQQNPFGEWGLAHWQSIHPKRMSDKIYLVLKKHGQPLHFTDITNHINNIKFDHKVAHAPTVHNELILDQRFVLVGRGMYALKEWGYEPGVVADVIMTVFARVKEPMTRDEIIEEVDKQRLVKRGTILLALTNRDRFIRHPDGKYALIAPKSDSVDATPSPDTSAPPVS